MSAVPDDNKAFYNRFLLIVAGLGGLLYGVDVGIIAGALPYLEATSGSHLGPTFHRGRSGVARQRDFDFVRRTSGGLDGAQMR